MDQQQIPSLPASFDHTAANTMTRNDAYRLMYRAVRNGVLVAALVITLIHAALFLVGWKLVSMAEDSKPVETQQPW